MLIRGLDYLPPVEFEFGDLLDAVLLADVEVVPDDDLGYRRLLIERFEKAGITRAAQSRDATCSRPRVAPQYLGINLAALRTDRDEVFRFLWQNALRLDVPTRLLHDRRVGLPSQRIGPDGLIVAESVATYVQMAEMTAAELETISELPLPDGLDPDTPVQLFGGGTLVFDQFGRLKLHVYKKVDDWRRQLRRIEYLDRSGRRDTGEAAGLLRRLGARSGVRRAARHQPELRGGMVSTPVSVESAHVPGRLRRLLPGVGRVRRAAGRRPRGAAPARSTSASTRKAREGRAPGRMSDVAKLIRKHTGGDARRARRHPPAQGPPVRLRGRRRAEILRALAPKRVLRPWTEDPAAAGARRRAGGAPGSPRTTAPVRASARYARAAVGRAAGGRGALGADVGLHKDVRAEAPEQVKNADAIALLDELAARRTGAGTCTPVRTPRSATSMPGLEVTVLGPPTVEQDPRVAKQREEDPEYWMAALHASLREAARTVPGEDGLTRTAMSARTRSGALGRRTAAPRRSRTRSPGWCATSTTPSTTPASSCCSRSAALSHAVPRRRADRELAVHPRPPRAEPDLKREAAGDRPVQGRPPRQPQRHPAGSARPVGGPARRAAAADRADVDARRACTARPRRRPCPARRS